MRIKGIFWKEGINGLGVGPACMRKLLPYRAEFDKPACLHDLLYDKGGTEKDRKRADKILLSDMLANSDNIGMMLFSAVYYLMTRCFGFMFFRYDL